MKDTPPQFDALVREYEPAVARIAARYARRAADIKDLAQEIWLNVWNSLERFAGRSSVSTWIYRIAINTAISFYRRRTHREIPPKPDSENTEASTAGEPLCEARLLQEFLDSLNPTNRAVLLLFLEGLEPAQIAEIIGSKPGSVATRLTRLRQQFEQDFVEG